MILQNEAEHVSLFQPLGENDHVRNRFRIAAFPDSTPLERHVRRGLGVRLLSWNSCGWKNESSGCRDEEAVGFVFQIHAAEFAAAGFVQEPAEFGGSLGRAEAGGVDV